MAQSKKDEIKEIIEKTEKFVSLTNKEPKLEILVVSTKNEQKKK